MAKATHTGTCQCCGATQKLPNGDLSKHGYTLENGWFNGTCLGAGSMPFEQGKGLIEKFIEMAKQSIIDNTAKCEEIESTCTGLTWRRSYRTDSEARKTYEPSGYYWEQAEIIAIEREDRDWTNYLWADKAGSDNIRTQREADAGNDIYGKSIEDIRREFNASYAKQFRKQIAEAEQYIIWQKGRIKNWKPAELTLIK